MKRIYRSFIISYDAVENISIFSLE